MLWIPLLVGLLGLTGSIPASAQTSPSEERTLIDRYQHARRHLLAQRLLQRERGLRILPPEPLPTQVDSLHETAPDPSERPQAVAQTFPLESMQSLHRLERGWFDETYADTKWSFLGAGAQRPTFFDTTRTLELRARLQAQFGDPTQTLADDNPREVKDERAQFEYWFVVNDSIPVRVTDANGPRDRGLIVMTQRRYRDRIFALRDTLLHSLRQPERAPYVDYYYDDTLERWYRTGFDGEAYFFEQVSRYDLVPGRRPRLDANRKESTSSSSNGENGSSSP